VLASRQVAIRGAFCNSRAAHARQSSACSRPAHLLLVAEEQAGGGWRLGGAGQKVQAVLGVAQQAQAHAQGWGSLGTCAGGDKGVVGDQGGRGGRWYCNAVWCSLTKPCAALRGLISTRQAWDILLKHCKASFWPSPQTML